MNITIRNAQMNDAPSIIRLICELAATAEETSQISDAYVTKYLSSPTSTILLAEMEQEVVGLLSYSLRPDLYHAGNCCLIEELIVQEAARGQGVGSLLLEELFSRLGQIGCAEVSVAAMRENTEALKFYRRHGLTDEAVFLERHIV